MKTIKNIKYLLLAAVVMLVPLATKPVAHADTFNTTTYSFPTSLHDIIEGPDGNMWILTNTSPYPVYKMSRSGPPYTQYSTTHNGSTFDFSDITLGSDGALWSIASYYIGSITTDGTVHTYFRPTESFGSPEAITSGPDGNLWFSVLGDGSTGHTGVIGRITTSGSFLPIYDVEGMPVSLVSDTAHNVVWYGANIKDSNNNYTMGAIGAIGMDGTRTVYDIPADVGTMTDMTMGPDGNIWFTGKGNKIGKLTSDGTYTIYTTSLPSGVSLRRITTGLDGYMWITLANADQIIRLAPDGSTTTYNLPANTYSHGASVVAAGSDGNIWVLGKANDSPAIIKIQTNYTDTDEDGLPDYVESANFADRNSIFCNQQQTVCEYPDPNTKDIYVENDWMVKPGDSGYSMKLSDTQVSILKAAFLNKGINLHIDTGQLGGGNEVLYNASIYFNPVSGQTDFYDYKEGGDGIAAQMSPLRLGIYHYLLTGQSYAENSASSGISHPGDDDLFVSYGLLKDDPSGFRYTSFDTGLSGTIMHELGHNLCFTGTSITYPGQPADCQYSGVDKYTSSAYASVMNYTEQSLMTDYSTGANGSPADHNDWQAIRLEDFTATGAGDSEHGAPVSNPALKKKPFRNIRPMHIKSIQGPTIKQLKLPIKKS